MVEVLKRGKWVIIFLILSLTGLTNIVAATFVSDAEGQKILVDMTSHMSTDIYPISSNCDRNIKVHTVLSDAIKSKANQLTTGITDRMKKAEVLFNYVARIPYPPDIEKISGGFRWSSPEEVLVGTCKDELTYPILKDKCKSADCKSKSSLLLSLLRTSGFSEKEAFWVGSSSELHSYVIIKNENRWIYADPTWLSAFSPQYSGDMPKPDSVGNDVYLVDDKCRGNINVNVLPEDPCKNVACNDRCESNRLLNNGRCENGRCVYAINSCDSGICQNNKCFSITEAPLPKFEKSTLYCDGDIVKQRLWNGTVLTILACQKGYCVTKYNEYLKESVATCDYPPPKPAVPIKFGTSRIFCDGNTVKQELYTGDIILLSPCTDGVCVVDEIGIAYCKVTPKVLDTSSKPRSNKTFLPEIVERPPSPPSTLTLKSVIQKFFNWINSLFGGSTFSVYPLQSCPSGYVKAREYCPPSPTCPINITCVQESQLTNGCFLLYDDAGITQKKCYGQYEKTPEFYGEGEQ